MIKQTAFDYKILASYLFPKGIFEYFDVTDVCENHTGIIEETSDERVLLHIYLDEKDARERAVNTTAKNTQRNTKARSVDVNHRD